MAIFAAGTDARLVLFLAELIATANGGALLELVVRVPICANAKLDAALQSLVSVGVLGGTWLADPISG